MIVILSKYGLNIEKVYIISIFISYQNVITIRSKLIHINEINISLDMWLLNSLFKFRRKSV